MKAWLHLVGRADLHKFAKEGLTCLLESCTAEEYAEVVDAIGGQATLRRSMGGWLRLGGWSYLDRIRAVRRHYSSNTGPAYGFTQ